MSYYVDNKIHNGPLNIHYYSIYILLLNIYIFISSYKGHTFALVCTEPYDLGSKVGRKEGRKCFI